MSILSDWLLRRHLIDTPVLDRLEDELRTIAGDFINVVDDRVTSILDPTTDYIDEEGTEAEYGDIIGVDRFFYKHYGVYVGDQAVIHYARINEELLEKSVIHQTDLETFLNGASRYFICKFPDTYGEPDMINIHSATLGSLYAPQWMSFYEYIKRERYHLYSPEETVRRAMGRMAEEKYDLAFNNCEHFAIWCKTGISESHQVNKVLSLIPLLKAAV